MNALVVTLNSSSAKSSAESGGYKYANPRTSTASSVKRSDSVLSQPMKVKVDTGKK